MAEKPTSNLEVIGWLNRRVADRAGQMDPTSVFRQAREAGLVPDWLALNWLLEHGFQEPWTPALFVLDFLRFYLTNRVAQLMVDPVATTPTLLPALLDVGAARHAVGYSRSPAVRELAGLTAFTGGVLDWHDQWRIPLVEGMDDSPSLGLPDLIVSMPPAGMRGGKGQLTPPNGEPVQLRDDAAGLSVLNALELSDTGEAIFLLPSSFLRNGNATGVRSRLNELGLYAHAALDVQQATRATGMAFVLLFVRREPVDDVFVGQLTPALGDVRQLIKNLVQRRNGAVPALGRLTSWTSFETFDKLVAAERVSVLVRKAKLQMRALAEVLAEEIRVPPRKGDVQREATPNTVYLPTFLNASVRSDSDGTGGQPPGFYQLVLDPGEANADYVAAMLNSELGRALRTTWAGGATIPSIRRSALRVAEIPLPALHTQQGAARTLTSIRSIRTALDEMDRELAANPLNAERVRRRLLSVGQEDHLLIWIEALPFPLASILWRYRADADVSAKVDHLLRFFEASAEFFVAVLLSAFARVPDLMQEEKAKWVGEDDQAGLRRATFGSWTHMGAAIGASVRRMLSGGLDDPRRARMRASFALHSDEFVSSLAGKELWKQLDEMRRERNADAHGGIRSAAERAQKLLRLETHLGTFQALMAEPMAEVQLVRPGAGARKRGVTHYVAAAILTGPHQIFQQRELDSLATLEDELQLTDVSDEPLQDALQLVPLIRLRDGPQDAANACYFYSRLDGSEAEFVSHHFEREARISESDPELVQLLDSLVSG